MYKGNIKDKPFKYDQVIAGADKNRLCAKKNRWAWIKSIKH